MRITKTVKIIKEEKIEYEIDYCCPEAEKYLFFDSESGRMCLDMPEMPGPYPISNCPFCQELILTTEYHNKSYPATGD